MGIGFSIYLIIVDVLSYNGMLARKVDGITSLSVRFEFKVVSR